MTTEAYVTLKEFLLEEAVDETTYSERQLSADLGIGLGATRAALARLRAEGLIIVTPKAGMRLPSLTPSAIVDFYEIRTVLETHVVTALARRRAQDIKEAKQFVERQRVAARACDARKCHSVDIEFHLALARAHGNAEIVRTLCGLRDRMRRLSPAIFSGREDRMNLSCDQHEQMLAYIAAGKVDEGRALLEEHLGSALDIVLARDDQTRFARKI
jgi:DNA-binding GntR family transcriptional regulator